MSQAKLSLRLLSVTFCLLNSLNKSIIVPCSSSPDTPVPLAVSLLSPKKVLTTLWYRNWDCRLCIHSTNICLGPAKSTMLLDWKPRFRKWSMLVLMLPEILFFGLVWFGFILRRGTLWTTKQRSHFLHKYWTNSQTKQEWGCFPGQTWSKNQ